MDDALAEVCLKSSAITPEQRCDAAMTLLQQTPNRPRRDRYIIRGKITSNFSAEERFPSMPSAVLAKDMLKKLPSTAVILSSDTKNQIKLKSFLNVF